MSVLTLLAGCGQSNETSLQALQGNPVRGRLALKQYACQACHRIPGITGSDVNVGPPLTGIAKRKYLAGSVPNTPENMVRWIHDPRQIDPLTAMPKMGVTESEATDMVAYLMSMD